MARQLLSLVLLLGLITRANAIWMPWTNSYTRTWSQEVESAPTECIGSITKAECREFYTKVPFSVLLTYYDVTFTEAHNCSHENGISCRYKRNYCPDLEIRYFCSDPNYGIPLIHSWALTCGSRTAIHPQESEENFCQTLQEMPRDVMNISQVGFSLVPAPNSFSDACAAHTANDAFIYLGAHLDPCVSDPSACPRGESTWSLWLNVTRSLSTSGPSVLLSAGRRGKFPADDPRQYGVHIARLADGAFRFGVRTKCHRLQTDLSSGRIPERTWFHLTMAISTVLQTVVVHIDGNRPNTLTRTQADAGSITLHSDQDSAFCHLTVLDRRLSHSEILGIFDGSIEPKDLNPMHHWPMTAEPTPGEYSCTQTTHNTAGDHAVILHGNGRYVPAPGALNATCAISVSDGHYIELTGAAEPCVYDPSQCSCSNSSWSVWMNITHSGDFTAPVVYLISAGAGTAGLVVNRTSNSSFDVVAKASGVNLVETVPSYLVPGKAWFHLAVLVDVFEESLVVYVDGKQMAPLYDYEESDISTEDQSPPSGPLVLGSIGDPGMTVAYSNLALYKGIRTPGEIHATPCGPLEEEGVPTIIMKQIPTSSPRNLTFRCLYRAVRTEATEVGFSWMYVIKYGATGGISTYTYYLPSQPAGQCVYESVYTFSTYRYGQLAEGTAYPGNATVVCNVTGRGYDSVKIDMQYRWTPWLSSTDAHNNSQGDNETLTHMRQVFPNVVCEHPAKVSCRERYTRDYNTYQSLQQSCGLDGLLCLHSMQSSRSLPYCRDYEVRFICPHENGTVPAVYPTPSIVPLTTWTADSLEGYCYSSKATVSANMSWAIYNSSDHTLTQAFSNESWLSSSGRQLYLDIKNPDALGLNGMYLVCFNRSGQPFSEYTSRIIDLIYPSTLAATTTGLSTTAVNTTVDTTTAAKTTVDTATAAKTTVDTTTAAKTTVDTATAAKTTVDTTTAAETTVDPPTAAETTVDTATARTTDTTTTEQPGTTRSATGARAQANSTDVQSASTQASVSSTAAGTPTTAGAQNSSAAATNGATSRPSAGPARDATSAAASADAAGTEGATADPPVNATGSTVTRPARGSSAAPATVTPPVLEGCEITSDVTSVMSCGNSSMIDVGSGQLDKAQQKELLNFLQFIGSTAQANLTAEEVSGITQVTLSVFSKLSDQTQGLSPEEQRSVLEETENAFNALAEFLEPNSCTMFGFQANKASLCKSPLGGEIPLMNSIESGDSLQFDQSALGLDLENLNVVAISEGQAALRLNDAPTTDGKTPEGEQNITDFLNSAVMTFTAFVKSNRTSLPVQFTLGHLGIGDSYILKPTESFTPVCVFQDFSGDQIKWSSWGCEIRWDLSTGNRTTCYCNHSTNFAILMQVSDAKIPEADLKILSTITFIGCGTSVCSLLLTLGIFIFLGRMLKFDRSFIHGNLSLAILVGQILFIGGIDRTELREVCTAIAVLLHFSYLAVFAWMLVEGVHLYRKIIKVYGSENTRMYPYAIFAWGLPAAISLVSYAIKSEGYGSEKSCWLDINSGLIWAFVAPALVVMAINLIVLAMVVRVIVKSADLVKEKKYDNIKSGLKGAIMLLPILGLTWIFGLMAVNGATILFQYLFTVFNAFQGVFIFLFNCVFNSEVRSAIRRKQDQLMQMSQHSVSVTQSVSMSCPGEPQATDSSSIQQNQAMHRRTKVCPMPFDD